MRKIFYRVCLVLVLSAATVVANEEVRQVQEELRKRNLYFGDINGQATPDLANALKRYQERKGFPATGTIDDLTATSLSVQRVKGAVAGPAATLPDMPILRSDRASQLPDALRIALQKEAEENPDAMPSPPPPAEQPGVSQDLTPQRVTQLVQDYLRDAQTSDIPAQTRYFAYPVEYFNHGRQETSFVTKDVQDYVKRWPERNYTLLQPVNFVAAEREGETIVEFLIGYQVRRGKYQATGKTKNNWIIRPEGEELKIVAIQEQRVRE